MKTVFLSLFILISGLVIADTGRYRLMFNTDPSTEITIGWEQISGSNPVIHYGTVDQGTNFAAYPMSQAPYRQVNYFAMDNRFAVLSGLTPNTVYYFVIRDSQGTSQRYWFRTCPNDNSETLSFISGGDSRSGYTQRQNSNRMVAKIRPHAVLFGGDLVNTPGNGSVQDWMDHWQLTITTDGQMFPIVHSFGNHEDYGTGGPNFIRDLFDTNYDVYYNVRFGGDLFSMYTLNGEVLPGHTIANTTVRNAQKTWLQTELQADNSIWKGAQYHRPILPHSSTKGDGADEYTDWVNLFYDNGVRVVMESDAHVVKMTDEVKPSFTGSPSGGTAGWFTTTGLDPDKGITFIGEGAWGTIRTNDDDHSITTASGSFYAFNWLLVDACKIEIRTIDTQNPNGVPDRAPGDYTSIPQGLEDQVWKPAQMPSGVRTITKCSPPNVNFEADQLSVFTGTTINFTDLTTDNPDTWSWDFGDGIGTSILQNPSYTYPNPGLYTVSLTCTNVDGSDVETKVDYILVQNPTAPTADFTVDNTNPLVGESINFTDLSSGVPSSWSWDFGDGSGTSTLQNPSYAYPAAGTYTVTLIATNAYGNDTEIKTNYITVVNGGSVTVNIANGNDDVEEANASGNLYFTSSDLELGYDGSTSNANQHVGLRYQNVNIPQGATITNAYIEFRADEADNTALVLYLAAHDLDDSPIWAGNADVSSRPRTTSEYAWVHNNTTAWSVGNIYNTNNIKHLIQEVVSRPGWNSGNSMSFVIWDDGIEDDERVGDSFEGGYAPILHVDFTLGSQAPPTYCPSYYTAQTSEFISNVTLNTLNNSTGNDDLSGYMDYTELSTDLEIDDTYQLDVTINTNGNNTVFCQAFFDWNQDGDFDDVDEAVNLGSVTNNAAALLSTSITIPSGAVLGNTRMRINVERNVNPGACNANHTGNAGETEDYTINILAAPLVPPVANFSANNNTICEGSSVLFNDLSTNDPDTWSWVITGPTTLTSSIQHPTLVFSTPGTYSVELTVTNSDGSDVYTENNLITVLANPTQPTISASASTTLCDGDEVILTSSEVSGNTWSSGETSNQITVSTTGNYDVTYTDGNGCSATSTQVSVTVVPNPTISLASFQNPINCGTTSGSIEINGTSTGDLSWSGAMSGVENNVTLPYTINGLSAGNYTIIFTENGCSSNTVLQLLEDPTPPATPTITASGDLTICADESVTLTASESSNILWSTGETTASVEINTSGMYDVTFTDGNGCSATSATIEVVVNALPAQPTIAASGSTTFCEGETIDLTASETSGVMWSTGETTSTIEVASSGSYSVTYTDGNGCTSESEEMVVLVNELPVVEFSLVAEACLEEGPITLDGGTPSGGTYNGPGVTGTTLDLVAAGEGTHEIVYSYTDANGCSNISTSSIIVESCLSLSQYENEHVLIYPNPTSDQITLVAKSEILPLEIAIYDGKGALVFEGKLTQSPSSIDVSTWENGMYTMVTKGSNVNLKLSFIKQ